MVNFNLKPCKKHTVYSGRVKFINNSAVQSPC